MIPVLAVIPRVFLSKTLLGMGKATGDNQLSIYSRAMATALDMVKQDS